MSALSNLLRKSTIEDHDEILTAANNEIEDYGGNPPLETLHTKVVALLKLDKCEEALALFEKEGNDLKSAALFEYAYTLYKLGEWKLAIQFAESLSGRGAQHLRAQAAYRADQGGNAAKIFADLTAAESETREQNEEADLKINVMATDAVMEWSRDGNLIPPQRKVTTREDLAVYERTYNAACASIGRGELQQADMLLGHARTLCLGTEFATEKEKAEELMFVAVQRLYVFIALGKFKEVGSIAAELGTPTSDVTTAAVFKQNQIVFPAATPTFNPYVSARMSDALGGMSKKNAHLGYQDAAIAANNFTFELMTKKFGKVQNRLKNIDTMLPQPSALAVANSLAVARYASKAECREPKEAIKKLLPLFETRKKDVALVVTLVQLYMAAKNHAGAIHVMETFMSSLDESDAENAKYQSVRYAPGIVAILVSLYSIEGRKKHIKDLLFKAASFWSTQTNPPTELLQAAGKALLESGDVKDLSEASDIFSFLVQKNPADRFSVAGLIASKAGGSESNAVKPLAQALTPLDQIISSVDVTALEKAGVPSLTSHGDLISRKRAALDSASKPAKKRVRKSRIPKGKDYDPNKPPNPERWLPLRDRSNYKPKGKKGKAKAQGLTQGGIEKDGAANEKKATPAAVVSAPSSKSKNKKKGKK